MVKKNFNVEVERTIRELNGQVCKKWDQVRADKHQIYSTRSVGERIVDIQSLRQALSKHAGIAARKARQQGSLCKVFLCFAGNSPFDEHPQSFRFIHRFAYSTADTQQLTKVACDAAEQLFKNGVRYCKIGA
ncbi:hypothetical protein ACUT6V_003427 [Vibrio cholerae]|uniref:DinB/UmuC family translesion DNA polymerase n=1 Tax=Vibrio sp. V12_P9A6T4 TaxID=1938667 RepID=UPI003F8EEEDB